jgi:hypothetical protein
MNTKTMRKAARDLEPGDVLVYGEDRAVVTRTDVGSHGVSISSVVLGDDIVSVGRHSLDSQFKVEIPAGLTPVQAAAEKLLDFVEDYEIFLKNHDPEYEHATKERRAQLSALLDEVCPPKPPTLEEAVTVLRELVSPRNALHSKYEKACEAAHALLARVPS